MTTKKIKFDAKSIDDLKHSGSGQDRYIDTKTQIPNCKLMLIVGVLSKTYYLEFRKNVNGKDAVKKSKLGKHPTMSLEQARKKFAIESTNLLSRDDVFLASEINKGMLFSEMMDFHEKDKGIAKGESYLFNEIREGMGGIQVKKLTRFKVQDYYKPQILAKNFHSANSRREIINRVWNYNVKNNEDCLFLESVKNPASWAIDGFVKEPSTRLIEKFQIKPLMDSIELVIHDDKKDLLKLFFYLGQHPYTEICLMRWDQIKNDKEYPDTKWWLMEKGFHKVKKIEHSVYLHPKVLEIIERQRGKDDTYIFTSKDNIKNGQRQPYGKSGFSKQMNVIKEYLEVQNIDIRCFRASITTHLRNMNDGHEPSYLLGQALPGISNTVYTRSEFKLQKMTMTNAWMDFIEDCK